MCSRRLVAVSQKYKAVKEYSFEGELALEAQRGSNPGRLLARANVSLAIGPEDKYRVDMQPVDKDAYLWSPTARRTGPTCPN
jgi:hypothetical protein